MFWGPIHVPIWLFYWKTSQNPCYFDKNHSQSTWTEKHDWTRTTDKQNFSSRKQFCTRTIFCARGRPAHICLSIMLVNGEGGRVGAGIFFWSYQQRRGHGASIMTWPPLSLACTWTGPTSGSNFLFSFVDHLTMCFHPGSGRWALIHGRLLLSAHLRARPWCMGCRQPSAGGKQSKNRQKKPNKKHKMFVSHFAPTWNTSYIDDALKALTMVFSIALSQLGWIEIV